MAVFLVVQSVSAQRGAFSRWQQEAGAKYALQVIVSDDGTYQPRGTVKLCPPPPAVVKAPGGHGESFSFLAVAPSRPCPPVQ